MKVHALVLKTPDDNVAELMALDEGSQVNVNLVEPANFLPFPQQRLNKHFVYVIGFLNHCVEALLSYLITNVLLPLIHLLGLFDEC